MPMICPARKSEEVGGLPESTESKEESKVSPPMETPPELVFRWVAVREWVPAESISKKTQPVFVPPPGLIASCVVQGSPAVREKVPSLKVIEVGSQRPSEFAYTI